MRACKSICLLPSQMRRRSEGIAFIPRVFLAPSPSSLLIFELAILSCPPIRRRSRPSRPLPSDATRALPPSLKSECHTNWNRSAKEKEREGQIGRQARARHRRTSHFCRVWNLRREEYRARPRQRGWESSGRLRAWSRTRGLIGASSPFSVTIPSLVS